MTDLVVIHDLGAPGGAPWSAAFGSWPGRVVAPDLPGHGSAPAPVGGHHELGDAVFVMVEHLPASDAEQPVLVGVGHNGHAARVLSIAGRSSALVLVDGLGGPWLDVPARNAALRDHRRQILATPAALAPHRAATTDPRADLVPGPTDRDHAQRTCEAILVPTLVIETPASRTPDAAQLVGCFADAVLVRVPSSDPAHVADAVARWWPSGTA